MNINAITTQSNRDQLAQCANQVVNQMFYGTLMAEFRKSNPSTLLDGGFASQCFTRELDMHLIDCLGKGRPSGLAQTLIRRLSPSGSSASGSVSLTNGVSHSSEVPNG